MSFVNTQPECLVAAAGTLTAIGSSMKAQNAAAAAPTLGIVPAASDEVSLLTACQFATQAQHFQSVVLLAEDIHDGLIRNLLTCATSYAATEAANAAAAG
jgi:PE family